MCLNKEKNISVKVVTSPRHAEELVGKVSLKDFLNSISVPNVIVNDIEDEGVKSFLSDSNGAFYLSLGVAWIFKKDFL